MCPHCNYTRWDDPGSLANPIYDDDQESYAGPSRGAFLTRGGVPTGQEPVNLRILEDIMSLLREVKDAIRGLKDTLEEVRSYAAGERKTEEDLRAVIEKANRELKVPGKGSRRPDTKGQKGN